MIDKINAKSKEELKAEVADYHRRRTEMIDKRRSKAHRANLEKLIDNDLEKTQINSKEKSFKNMSFQEKLFYKNYQKEIKDFDLSKYYIDTSKEDKTTFKSIQKGIE